MNESTVGLGNGADTTKTTAATPVKKTRGTVTSDPNLVACTRITATLDKLDDAGRKFVLDYVCGKYNR